MRSTPIALDGAVVAVTGSARGIGLETARAFRARGATVAVCDVDTEAAADAATAIGARAFEIDVADRGSFAACLAAVSEQLGPVDVLVNNAGIMPAGAFVDERDATTDAILAINVAGVITGTRLALPAMLERRRGHVVNVASLLGKVQLPGLATYVASKHAVVGLGKAVRAELAGSGVTLTTVLPPIVNTELSSGIALPPLAARFIRVEPSEIAAAVVGSVAHRRGEVVVPRWLGAAVRLQPLIPERLEAAARRRFGDDAALKGVDPDQRAAYDLRLDRLV